MNFRASAVSLFHPRGWVVAHAIVLQPSHCNLTWKASPGWEQPLCPSSCPSALLPTASVGQFLSPNDFPHQNLQDMRPAPFGSCFLCYRCSLEKKDGRCNLSAEQTFPRLLPNETSFVENFKAVANNLGWEKSKAKSTAGLPSLYSCWKALASEKQMLCGK